MQFCHHLTARCYSQHLFCNAGIFTVFRKVLLHAQPFCLLSTLLELYWNLVTSSIAPFKKSEVVQLLEFNFKKLNFITKLNFNIRQSGPVLRFGSLVYNDSWCQWPSKIMDLTYRIHEYILTSLRLRRCCNSMQRVCLNCNVDIYECWETHPIRPLVPNTWTYLLTVYILWF
jgi:hypothetical protein